MSLSKRLRPDVEAAPWVIEEVTVLEAEIERLTRNLGICKTSYEVLDERYWKSATEKERLRALLSEAREVIHDEVEANYPWKDKYPRHMLRYKADMDIVRRIDAALAPETKP